MVRGLRAGRTHQNAAGGVQDEGFADGSDESCGLACAGRPPKNRRARARRHQRQYFALLVVEWAGVQKGEAAPDDGRASAVAGTIRLRGTELCGWPRDARGPVYETGGTRRRKVGGSPMLTKESGIATVMESKFVKCTQPRTTRLAAA